MKKPETSPMINQPDTATMAALDQIFSDSSVAQAAGNLVKARVAVLELRDRGAFRGLVPAISEAVRTSTKKGKVPAIKDVLKALREATEEADHLYEEALDNIELHKAACKAFSLSRRPLRSAVSDRLTALSNEKEWLRNRLDAIKHVGVGASPNYEALKSVGLTDEQIRKVDPNIEPAIESERKHRSRLYEVIPQIDALRKFTATGDTTHLAGLGFDELIKAAEDPDWQSVQIAQTVGA